MNRLTARDLLDLVIDAGTWESWDTPPIPVATDSDYAEALLRAQEKTGLDESVLTGSASVRGRRVAIIVCEFGFLGGSIGVAAGRTPRRRHPSSHPRAAAPSCASHLRGNAYAGRDNGFSADGQDHRGAHQAQRSAPALHRLPPKPHHRRRIRVLGVTRSRDDRGARSPRWDSLGPRVFEALYNSPFPAGVQTAENLHEHGLIDAVRPPDQLAEIVDRAVAHHHLETSWVLVAE